MKIGIILGSVREGRLGERVAKWVLRKSIAQDFDAELLDLKDYPLPFYEEAEAPFELKGPYKSDVANKWAAKVSEFEGYIIVTPEYNHGYPAVLKNALDYLFHPWIDKPVTFVSYSNGVIGGARSVEQLRPVAANIKLVALGATHIGRAQDVLSPEGEVLSGPFDSILDKLLADLKVWVEVLNAKRNK